MLPTCSGQLRGDLRPVPHHIILPVLAETVISIVIHVVIILVILQGIGSHPANVPIQNCSSTLSFIVYLFTKILDDGLTTEAMPLEMVMVWPPLVLMVFIPSHCL